MPPMPGAKLPTTAAAPPRVANRDRQKVADMVKRRQSTRYVTAAEAGDMPALPIMPDLATIMGAGGRKASVMRIQDLDVDLDAFRDPRFVPEQCKNIGLDEC